MYWLTYIFLKNLSLSYQTCQKAYLDIMLNLRSVNKTGKFTQMLFESISTCYRITQSQDKVNIYQKKDRRYVNEKGRGRKSERKKEKIRERKRKREIATYNLHVQMQTTN